MSLYSNFTGATLSSNVTAMTTGPLGGVFFWLNTPGFPQPGCYVEMLSAGTYTVYYPPHLLNHLAGQCVVNNWANKMYMGVTHSTGMAPIDTLMLSFDHNSYSGFNQGPGVNANNSKYLDINRVKALIQNRGDMWWDVGNTGTAQYEVPKGFGVNSGFAAAL